MLRHDVHCDLGKIQVCADACRGGASGRGDEYLVDGIDVDVVRRGIRGFQINGDAGTGGRTACRNIPGRLISSVSFFFPARCLRVCNHKEARELNHDPSIGPRTVILTKPAFDIRQEFGFFLLRKRGEIRAQPAAAIPLDHLRAAVHDVHVGSLPNGEMLRNAGKDIVILFRTVSKQILFAARTDFILPR